jgi:hypothetical protein
MSFLDRTVELSISKDGYYPMRYDTNIDSEGKLEATSRSSR